VKITVDIESCGAAVVALARADVGPEGSNADAFGGRI
jgi:hypothetical protein